MKQGSEFLALEHLPLAELELQPSDWWDRVLAVVGFEGTAIRPPTPEIPAVHVRTPLLSGAPVVEVLRSGEPLESGRVGRLRYRRGRSLLFVCIELAEAEFAGPGPAASGSSLHDATAQAYAELFAGLNALGCPHLMRVWNYFADINLDAGSGERYWQFNSARQDAFANARRSPLSGVPAASALGARGPAPLMVYGIASPIAPIALENPRQHSAWTYPPQYGSRSPLFSRACLGTLAQAQVLFISGTASILGHETAHTGDAAEQTRETLRNIRALLDGANSQVGRDRFRLDTLTYKVYLRRAEDLRIIQEQLHGEIGASAPMLYLLADICRRDLLVEIEAICV